MTQQQMFKTAQWMGGIFVLITASVSIVVFLFTSFESKGDARDFRNSIDKRLERIESKLDGILSKQHN